MEESTHRVIDFCITASFQTTCISVDIVSDCAFKDLDKTEVKLLVKDLKNRYEIKPLIECGDKLNQYQIIKYCIRVFVDRDIKERVTPEIIYKINEIVVKQIALLN